MNQLVVIFLRGAADGLSLLVPTADPLYRAARPTLAVPATGTLPLAPGWGLHASAPRLAALWDRGQLSCVPACGPAQATRSHFSAQFVAEHLADDDSPTGWIGRHLALTASRSTSAFRAVAVGGLAVPLTLQGGPGAIGLTSLAGLRLGTVQRSRRSVGLPARGSSTPTVGELDSLWRDAEAPAAEGARVALGVLDAARSTGSEVTAPGSGTGGSDPGSDRASGDGGDGRDGRDGRDGEDREDREDGGNGGNETGGVFGQVHEILGSGLATEIVMVNLGGWDTHSDQGAQGAGTMARLIGGLDTGIGGVLDAHPDTTVLVVTEFGRRVAQNDSEGTDHGRGSLALVAGAGAAGGIMGVWPGLSNLDQGDVAAVNDLALVIGEVAQRVLNTPDPAKVVPGTDPTRFLGVAA